jgi:hypothetical protein
VSSIYNSPNCSSYCSVRRGDFRNRENQSLTESKSNREVCERCGHKPKDGRLYLFVQKKRELDICSKCFHELEEAQTDLMPPKEDDK